MNAKKLLSTLLSAAMAVSMLAGCFGGGGNKNYSDEAADAANAAQSTVVFATDTTLAKSLQDALADGLTQLDEIDDAMEADENLKPLLTSGWDLDIFAAQGEDAEAAAKTIAEQYIVSAVIGKKAEGKIAMVLHDGNGYYYVAVLTYGNGGSGSGGGAGGGSGSGDGGNRPGPGDDDDEEENGRVFLTGIQVSGNYSTEYYEGEFFDNQNLVVEACYNNGDVKVVTDYKLSCDGFDGDDKLKPGKYNVVVEYEGFTAEIPISVTSIVLDNLIVTTGNTFQKEYFVGDEFDSTGMEITATYTDGSDKELTIADCELSVTGLDGDKKFTKAGTQTITVTYTEDGISKSDTVTVNVIKIAWKSGEVTCSKTYTLGDTFNEDSLAVKVEYTDTSTETITKFDKIEFVPKTAINEDNRFTTAGEVTIQVTYTDKFGEAHEGSVTIKVNNKNPEIVGNLAVTTDKTFEVGDQIQSSDLTVTVTYKDALGKEWTETIKDFTITSPTGVFTKADDQYPVSVAYEDQYGNKATGSTTVVVEEKKPVLTSIKVEQKGTIYVDEKISGSDLTVTAYDQNGKEMEVTLEFVSASPNSFDTAGPHKNVSVTYKDKDGKQYTDENVTITVKEPYVTGIEVMGNKYVEREWRAGEHDDTVFKVWDFKLFVGWKELYCDDIAIQVNYSNGDTFKINKDNIQEYVEKGWLTADPNNFEFEDCGRTHLVTISYQDNTMNEPKTAFMNVRVFLIH